jgi:phage tail-like protein
VKWDGAYVAGITRVSGLGRTVQAVEYREGGDATAVRRVPGAVSYEAITIERGITHDTAFEDWADQVKQPAAGAGAGGGPGGYTKNIRIEVLTEAGQPVIAFDVYRCWPSVYRPLPELVAGLPLRLVESITLVHDGWERDTAVVFPG